MTRLILIGTMVGSMAVLGTAETASAGHRCGGYGYSMGYYSTPGYDSSYSPGNYGGYSYQALPRYYTYPGYYNYPGGYSSYYGYGGYGIGSPYYSSYGYGSGYYSPGFSFSIGRGYGGYGGYGYGGRSYGGWGNRGFGYGGFGNRGWGNRGWGRGW